jgi:hypothetical protein
MGDRARRVRSSRVGITAIDFGFAGRCNGSGGRGDISLRGDSGVRASYARPEQRSERGSVRLRSVRRAH